jgi:single-strand DNA-binding protein
MADSTATLIGNITRDPELRFTASGQAIASFGIAVNRRWQKNGEWVEQTSFFNVSAWGQLGENVAESLGKGTRVVVYGRLEQREYETKEGEKRSVVEIVADDVAPSMRWATVTVSKVNRQTAGDSGPRQHADADSGRSGRSRGASSGSYGDEEPF